MFLGGIAREIKEFHLTIRPILWRRHDQLSIARNYPSPAKASGRMGEVYRVVRKAFAKDGLALLRRVA
jgi:hypothetical protein